MRGWGPCSAQLEEAISMAQSEVESEYKNMTKEEYIQYVGGLYYMELRCEEIYVRSAQLEEAISMAQSEVESEYKNMTKEEYIQYVGGLYYMELRCEEIYVRLEQIEKEAEELLG